MPCCCRHERKFHISIVPVSGGVPTFRTFARMRSTDQLTALNLATFLWITETDLHTGRERVHISSKHDCWAMAVAEYTDYYGFAARQRAISLWSISILR